MANVYKQEPPFCVRVEFTEGCNLRCDFCGIKAIRPKVGMYKFMTVELARKIAEDIAAAKWNSRLEFTMHGEPTMNPKAAEIIAEFRKALPRNQLMMTSNGGGLAGHPAPRVQALFDAGLNILALDDYEGQNYVALIKQSVQDKHPIYEYPAAGAQYSPHHRWPRSTKAIVIIQDIRVATTGGHSKLNNHCGTAGPLDLSTIDKRCAMPFRSMAVRWNGNVSICCNDYLGVSHMGSVTSATMAEVWNNEVFTAARRKLYHHQRDFTPCRGCDYITFRNGLLPDKMGKERLPKPGKKEAEILARAVQGTPYAKQY